MGKKQLILKSYKMSFSPFDKEKKEKIQIKASDVGHLFTINDLKSTVPCECGNCNYADLGKEFVWTKTSTYREAIGNTDFDFSHIACPKCKSKLIYLIEPQPNTTQ